MSKLQIKEDNRSKIRRIDQKFEIMRTVLAIVIALVIVLLVISLVSSDPAKAIKILLLGPITNPRQFGNVILLTIPLSFTGIATAIIFKSNRFNMSSEGSFYFGALIAAIIGVNSPFSPLLTIIMALAAGFISGAIIGFVPAYLNKKFETSELVISLMMNYIITHFVLFLFLNYYRDPVSINVESLPLKDGVSLGSMFYLGKSNIHYGLVIAIVLAVVSYIVLFKTKWGYALRATGINEKFAQYSGIKTQSVILFAQVIGVGIARLGGAVEMLGRYSTFRYASSPGFGFDGVLIAALVKNNPLYVPLGAFFLAYIRIGADMINFTTDVPAEIISIVQASIILLISAKSFLSMWKQRAINKASISLNEGEI